jgi:hypothetical protein
MKNANPGLLGVFTFSQGCCMDELRVILLPVTYLSY